MLRRYDQRWREELEGEISRGMLLRSLFSRLSDRRIDGLFKLVHQDGIMGIIHRKARFDWHDELISSLMEHAFFPRFFGKRTRKTGSAAATA
jgi:flavin-dependent dehydrogenase